MLLLLLLFLVNFSFTRHPEMEMKMHKKVSVIIIERELLSFSVEKKKLKFTSKNCKMNVCHFYSELFSYEFKIGRYRFVHAIISIDILVARATFSLLLFLFHLPGSPSTLMIMIKF